MEYMRPCDAHVISQDEKRSAQKRRGARNIFFGKCFRNAKKAASGSSAEKRREGIRNPHSFSPKITREKATMP